MFLLAACALFVGVSQAQATPVLQLDIVNGYYDNTTQTVQASADDFTLVALLTIPSGSNVAEYLSQSYYISAAVMPQVQRNDSLGSFTFAGSNYDVTSDLVYGTPPVEVFDLNGADPGDLPGHLIFPTFFREFGFQFSANNVTRTYEVPQNAGQGPIAPSVGDPISYYATFTVHNGLLQTLGLHFDLYNAYFNRCASERTSCDRDLFLYAPFDRDAESHRVPEPASMSLVGLGLLAAAGHLRRRRAATQA